MDFDDERLETTDGAGLKSFKVPKRSFSNTCSIENVPLESSEFREGIMAKIKSYFKVPNSVNNFKIIKAYNINTTENERNFNKKKQVIRKQYSPHAAVELYGFLFLNSMEELESIVKTGKLSIGNLKESYIGKPEMGLSLCQYADIYHGGEGKFFPKNGILLIVKYLRGRVCYVLEDINPLDAQPNFDCHISKSFNQDSYPSMYRAFQSTQVYLYEYSEDFDIINSPSHVLIWAAVEFQWNVNSLYKLASVPLTVQTQTKDVNQKSIEKRNKLSHRVTGSVGLRIKQNFIDCTPVFCTNLQLIAPNSSNNNHSDCTGPEVVLDVPVTLVSYNSLWSLHGSLITPSWKITDLIEWSNFEQFLLNYHWRVNSANNNSTTLEESNNFLSDVLSKRVTLSRNIENKLVASEYTSTNTNHKWLPKNAYFISYYRMVVNDPSKDRAKIARLIEYFLETKTVGRIRLEDNPDSILYVFPDCNLSQNFGIPSVRTLDVNYLHVLLLKFRPIDYDMDKFDEELETSLTSRISELSINQETGQDESLILKHVLLQSARNQNTVQKQKLRQMCGVNLDAPMTFSDISFTIPTKSPISTVTSSPSSQKSSSSAVTKLKRSVSTVSVDSSNIAALDRPYDPTENPLGLSDDSRKSLANLPQKRNHDFINKSNEKKPAVKMDAESEALRKKSKKEEKAKLNNKLLEIFAKIENTTIPEIDNTDVDNEKTAQNANNGHVEKDIPNNSYSTLLDRTKFQKTPYRNGVSFYNPEGNTSSQNNNASSDYSSDKDLRFKDTVAISREVERYSTSPSDYNSYQHHRRPPPTYSTNYNYRPAINGMNPVVHSHTHIPEQNSNYYDQNQQHHYKQSPPKQNYNNQHYSNVPHNNSNNNNNNYQQYNNNRQNNNPKKTTPTNSCYYK